MQLRDYQTDCVKSIHEEWIFNNSVLAVLATGLGKTVIFSEIVRRWTRGRCLIVVPQIELIHQAANKVVAATGVMPAIEQGYNRSDEKSFYRSPFIIGSKQTLTGKSKRYQRLEDISLVVVDEAHGATTHLYKEMLDFYVAKGAQVLGVTATPKRHDGVALGNIFEKCAYQLDICDAIPLGWLVSARAQCIQLQSLDLSQVACSKSGEGDFKESELAKVMEDEKVVFEIAEVVARESDNLKTAVFCASVNEARAVAELLVDRYGTRADWVCGDKMRCDDQRRKQVLESFTEDPDGIQIVCNVGVLTTGWDFPGLEHIVVARPTRSLTLYTQIFGRGTRALPGVVDFEGSTPETRRTAIAASRKPFFKMTDLRDNSLQHKLITAVDVLGGSMGIAVINRAKSEVNKAGGPVDLEQLLADAKRVEDERERARRAAIESKAQYKKVDVDPFDGYQRGSVDMGKPVNKGPVMVFGKHRGKPLSALPGGYINWLATKCNLKDGWFKKAVMAEYANRKGVRS